MHCRFATLQQEALNGMKLLPSYVIGNAVTESEFDFYNDDLPNATTLRHELQLWKSFWKRVEPGELPTTAHQCLTACNDRQFPNIKTILIILCTLPVTSAESERSFSSLRRLKTYCRSTMVQDRINGLSLIYIHRDIDVDINKIIDTFAQTKPRRMLLSDAMRDGND